MRIFNSNLKQSPQFVSSHGAWLVDAKGNKIFDTWLGSGSLPFGHREPSFHRVDLDLLPDGAPIDDDLFPDLENATGWAIGGIGFQTSGSSAIARACRIARAATGKTKIAVIQSFWHGSDDHFLFTGATRDPISAGVPETAQANSFWFESIDHFLDSADFSEYAAVLMEPYQGANPSRTTLQSKQETWRDTLRQNQIFLVIDEIITGFRERFGSCTASRQSKPDIVVFGKAIGNGFPTGVVLTTPEVATKTPEKFFWGGTFSASPTQIHCITGNLKKLQMLNYQQLQSHLQDIIQHLNTRIADLGLNLEIVHGCGFARIRDQSSTAAARAFVRSEKSDFDTLRKIELDERIYLGSNGLIFPSVYNIKDHLP